MHRAAVIGGTSGIGLGVVLILLEKGYEHIYVVGKDKPLKSDIPPKYFENYLNRTSFLKANLNDEDYTIFDSIQDIDTLIFTAGFGRVTLFEDLTSCEIKNLVKCNELAAIQIIKKYYRHINSERDFYSAFIVSICGHIVSPLFSVYGAAKSGLRMFIENINAELTATGKSNRILECSPGKIDGTRFSGGSNKIENLLDLAQQIVEKTLSKETLFIPLYNEIYKNVINEYCKNPVSFGLSSYQYKIDNLRINNKPQVVIGFLSGTFDLFHIGHLNLLKKAKEECDYLIVSVHESGAWKGKNTFIPYEERLEIVKSIKYVDQVVKDYKEDIDAWKDFHYHKLFVGSDYKGSDRFVKYEAFFKGKDTQIIYFPYTKGTSSTKLREVLNKSLIKK